MKKTSVIFLCVLIGLIKGKSTKGEDEFVRVKGVQLIYEGKPFYGNGFNAYWLMYEGSNPSERENVSIAFQQASNRSLSIARTWAFSDGGYSPLQSSPGVYNEKMFKGLDFVVDEAKKNGIKLVLSLVNNYKDYGGKNQYVEWAKSKGQSLSSEDDFFINDLVKSFYKNHIKSVLNRVNSISGVAYKDDPTIMAWELMNEPRCTSDPSGKTLQGWISEMASYLKSIDRKHLVEIGVEGFYGESTPEKKQYNPNTFETGNDFIAHNQIPAIDFATVHSYPDQWLGNPNAQVQLSFTKQWVNKHIEDSQTILKKPVLFAEFGKSYKVHDYTSKDRDELYNTIFSTIYSSASSGGAASGGLFWHLLSKGMDNFRDGYEVILDGDDKKSVSVVGIISDQAQRMSRLREGDGKGRETKRRKR